MTSLTLALLRRRVAHLLKPSIEPPSGQDSLKLEEDCRKLLTQAAHVARLNHRTKYEVDELARLCAGIHDHALELKRRAEAADQRYES
jgi:hypothetical protein